MRARSIKSKVSGSWYWISGAIATQPEKHFCELLVSIAERFAEQQCAQHKASESINRTWSRPISTFYSPSIDFCRFVNLSRRESTFDPSRCYCRNYHRQSVTNRFENIRLGIEIRQCFLRVSGWMVEESMDPINCVTRKIQLRLRAYNLRRIWERCLN